MINLLPPELKTSYIYARRNVGLRRWLTILVVTLIGVGALATFGLLRIHQSSQSASAQVVALDTQLEAAHLTQTKKEVQNVSNSLKLAVKVLSNEVLFSKLIQQVGAVMPRGTLLSGLTIDQVNGGLGLQAQSTSYNSGTQIQVNLSDPNNKLFSKVDINSIHCVQAVADALTPYPCTVDLRALFNTDNPYLFINQGNKKQ